MPFPPFFVTECLEIGRTPGGCPADPGREACCQPRGLLGGRGAGLRVPWRPGPGRHACRPPLCHSRSQGLRLRLTKPQHKGTQNKASQNLEWPSFPGWRTPGARAWPACPPTSSPLSPGPSLDLPPLLLSGTKKIIIITSELFLARAPLVLLSDFSLARARKLLAGGGLC